MIALNSQYQNKNKFDDIATRKIIDYKYIDQ